MNEKMTKPFFPKNDKGKTYIHRITVYEQKNCNRIEREICIEVQNALQDVIVEKASIEPEKENGKK